MSDNKNSKTIGLVAGNRRLPFQFAEFAKRSGWDLHVIGLKGEVDEKLKDEVAPGRYTEFHVNEISKGIQFLKRQGIDEIVFIGGCARAKFTFNLDLVKVLARLLFMKNKHKGVFTIILSMFEKGGIKVRAIQDLMPELLIGEGSLGSVKPSDDDIAAFQKNLPAILDYTRSGVGQAVIIYKGEILAYEGFKGTDDLVRRATAKRSELGGTTGGVMAKIMEPGQDGRIDFPVVGTMTVETLSKYGIDGVFVEAGGAIADDIADTVKVADAKGVFVYGVGINS